MGQFDPNELLQKTAAGALVTRRPPIPVGVWPMLIESLDAGSGMSKKPDEATGMDRVYYYVDFKLSCSDPAVLEATGMKEKAFLYRHRVFISIDEETGELDLENNLTLGQMMEACGINDGSHSIGDLENRELQVTVQHSREGLKDPNAPPYANAVAFAPIE